MEFDPGAVGVKGSLFGFPYRPEQAEIVIIPVPWEVTVSDKEGTRLAPSGILEESTQLDFMIQGVEKPWELKSAMQKPLRFQEHDRARSIAKEIINDLENARIISDEKVAYVNDSSHLMNEMVYNSACEVIRDGKSCCTVGGDHSTPFGLMQALAETSDFGILQIDAHMDMREAYEGFTYSHASIMFNAIQLPGVQSITQVAIRDYSVHEAALSSSHSKPIITFFDSDLRRDRYRGTSWMDQVKQIVETLPSKIYISFDIDGLDPALCPGTGTPVPGGLQFDESMVLVEEVAKSGREIVGFDLSEVGDQKWDTMVGARVLYRLCTYMGLSKGKLSWQ